MRIITLLLTAIVCHFSGFGQKNNFLPGYYITNKGDTINGFALIQNKSKISSFNFKSSPDSAGSVTITALDCKEIAFGKEAYVVWSGKRNLEYVNGNDLSTINRVNEFATDTICIRQIYQGKEFTVYQYASQKNHFFMKYNGSIDELILDYDYFPEYHRLASSNFQKPAYVVHKTYQMQIYAMLNKMINSPKKANLLSMTEYDRHSLLKLFKALDR